MARRTVRSSKAGAAKTPRRVAAAPRAKSKPAPAETRRAAKPASKPMDVVAPPPAQPAVAAEARPSAWHAGLLAEMVRGLQRMSETLARAESAKTGDSPGEAAGSRRSRKR